MKKPDVISKGRYNMRSGEIRERFLNFFKDKQHTIVSSDLLVPKNDPTLLFTGAGMNQFKEQFMGKNISYTRAASCQKCFRTGDLENVGKTPRHHTFFEMLGNFSFGDYFKREAIAWAWEFMTAELGIDKKLLWISVYEEDEESYQIWLNEIKIPREKIVKLGQHDNFWPADAPSKGPNGPCGPCSEIFYDWGADTGCGKSDCSPACDCGRFVEVWNLVFTEFDRKPDGAMASLPNKNIDTGMGLERITSVMQGGRTNFDTDLFEPVFADIRKALGKTADSMPRQDLCLIADHIRAAVFAIADGVSPSNEKQGYVVRKLIRRAYLRSDRLGPFLYKLVPAIARVMGGVYPDVMDKREHIAAIVEEEEKKFNETLNTAMPVFLNMSDNSNKLSGEQVFKLVDTYGLPIDVIEEEAVKRNISIDLAGFEENMRDRKEQSRKGSNITSDFIFKPDKFDNAPRPEYTSGLPLEARIEFILKNDEPADSVEAGDCAEIITSPQSLELYAEAGGQAGDKGVIENAGNRMDFVNTREVDGRKVLQVAVKEGSFRKGDKVIVDYDAEEKNDTARNHTATHLLQSALRRILGDHVRQSGSYVDSRRLRFDFTHMKKLTDREIRMVEDEVNRWISEGVNVSKETKNINDAKQEGALSFFGEKYGDVVRVVSVGDYSKEFCGGTHVDNTAEIGVFKIVHESAVASGIRRIEAFTGKRAAQWIRDKIADIKNECAALSGGGTITIDGRVAEYASDILGNGILIDGKVIHDFWEIIMPAFLEVRDMLEKTAKEKKKREEEDIFTRVMAQLDNAAGNPDVSGEISFIPVIFDGLDMTMLRRAAGYLEKKTRSAVILLGSRNGDKAYLMCTVTVDLKDSGISAVDIINQVSQNIEGGGGGKPAFAQAGGKNPGGLEAAMEQAKAIIKNRAL
ncbi:MAG: alanine--tRNA ligase [Candidatus Omnitrophota bacterium]